MKIETLIALLQVMAAEHPGSEVVIHQFLEDEAYAVHGVSYEKDKTVEIL